jgi:diguanylate cyclase (GGDEF)-like protein
LTLIGNYSQDREARLAFLRTQQHAETIGALANSNENLAAAAMTDSLTGLANRSSLDVYLSTLWSQAPLSSVSCSVVMLDIDHFKNLNDQYGHLYGDRVIKRVAHLLSEALRGEDDFIARFGGEEFLVILPRTAIPTASLIAERLRGVVELAGLPFLRAGEIPITGMRATISCGVASGTSELYPNPYDLLGAADEALYRAKRDGRNLVRNSVSTLQAS